MIIPLALGAAALALLGKSAGDSHRRDLTRRFTSTTLVASSEDGVYDTVAMPNTTKTLTHILNAAAQHGMSTFTTPDGTKIAFDLDEKSRMWTARGFELFMSPKDIKFSRRT